MQYRPEVDGLRALAVLPVILYHAKLPYFQGGFVGVDVFFVISGYLITRIILSELFTSSFSLVNFYERRARRILPALFCVLTLSSDIFLSKTLCSFLSFFVSSVYFLFFLSSSTYSRFQSYNRVVTGSVFVILLEFNGENRDYYFEIF